jgi:hypothetical protein
MVEDTTIDIGERDECTLYMEKGRSALVCIYGLQVHRYHRPLLRNASIKSRSRSGRIIQKHTWIAEPARYRNPSYWVVLRLEHSADCKNRKQTPRSDRAIREQRVISKLLFNLSIEAPSFLNLGCDSTGRVKVPSASQTNPRFNFKSVPFTSSLNTTA